MAKLPQDKQAALKFIEQYNSAVKTCLEQDNISALRDTMEIRDQFIKEFFERFSNELTSKDISFFSEIKAQDEVVNKNMKAVKSSVFSKSEKYKKFRHGIKSYTSIANKKHE